MSGPETIHQAARAADVAALRAFLDKDPSALELVEGEYSSFKFTPFLSGASHKCIVEELHRRGANVNAVDATGRNAAHLVVAGGGQAVMEKLQVLHDVGVHMSVVSKRQMTPLSMVMVKTLSPSIARALISWSDVDVDAGVPRPLAQVCATRYGGDALEMPILRQLLHRGAADFSPELDDHPPILDLVQKGSTARFRLMVAYGARIPSDAIAVELRQGHDATHVGGLLVAHGSVVRPLV